jgi:hypothetical protein
MAQQNSIQWLVENAEDFFGHLLSPSIIEEAEEIHKKEIQTAYELGKMSYPSNPEDYYNDIFKKADDDINEQEILEQAAATNIDKVKAVRDYSGHWYIIPNELYQNFLKDLDNEDMVDSGKFSEKYGKYMTDGDLNLVQLYANI